MTEPLTEDKPTNKWLIFFFTAIGIFMSTLDGSIVNIALPSIMKDLDVSMSTVSWVVLIYLLTVTSLLLSFGRISDIVGRRIIYGSGLAIFSVGSLCCGLADTITFLIISRAIQGMGAAMIMTSTPALIADTFPPHQRGIALGMMGTIVAGGLTAGPPIGGLILSYFSWRYIFFINIPIGVFAAIAILLVLKNLGAEKKAREPFDYPGAILLTTFTSAFLLFIANSHSWGVTSAKSITAGVTAIVSFCLLLFFETKKDYPLIDLDLFKIRLFGLPVLTAAMVFTALFTMVFLMPFYLILAAGFTEKQTGFIMIIPFLMLFAVSPCSGYLSDKTGSRILCTTGLCLLGLALLRLSMIPADASIVTIGFPLALAGIGTALFLPPNTATALSAVPPEQRGISSGTIAAARNFGMVIGVAMAETLFNYRFALLSGGKTLASYTPAMAPVFMGAFKTAILSGAVAAFAGMFFAFMRGPEKSR